MYIEYELSVHGLWIIHLLSGRPLHVVCGIYIVAFQTFRLRGLRYI